MELIITEAKPCILPGTVLSDVKTDPLVDTANEKRDRLIGDDRAENEKGGND